MPTTMRELALRTAAEALQAFHHPYAYAAFSGARRADMLAA